MCAAAVLAAYEGRLTDPLPEGCQAAQSSTRAWKAVVAASHADGGEGGDAVRSKAPPRTRTFRDVHHCVNAGSTIGTPSVTRGSVVVTAAIERSCRLAAARSVCGLLWPLPAAVAAVESQ